MGTDIHGPWLEWRRPLTKEDANWDCVCEMYFHRHYTLFALMADVRSGWLRDGVPTMKSKGFPRDASYAARLKYTLDVYKSGDPADQYGCTPEQATRWVKQGASTVWSTATDGRVTCITGPDWHHASWLSTGEVSGLFERFHAQQKAACASQREKYEEIAAMATTSPAAKRLIQQHGWPSFDPMQEPMLLQLEALLGMMKFLQTPERPCRIVFFFDN